MSDKLYKSKRYDCLFSCIRDYIACCKHHNQEPEEFIYEAEPFTLQISIFDLVDVLAEKLACRPPIDSDDANAYEEFEEAQCSVQEMLDKYHIPDFISAINNLIKEHSFGFCLGKKVNVIEELEKKQ